MLRIPQAINMERQTKLKVWRKGDMERLLGQAEDFLRNAPHQGFEQLTDITRDKDPQYFLDIVKKKNGIMEKYIKDLYGNPQAPINGRLKGLFFRAVVNWKTGKPFPNSPFGSLRLQVSADELITPDKHLYFADFYCMHKQGQEQCNKHNITLVLCEPDSEADRFCRSALPRLDIHDNEFLYIDEDDDAIFVTNGRHGGAYVEVFYTENIDLRSVTGDYSTIEQFIRSRDPNPRKNKACPYCNLR